MAEDKKGGGQKTDWAAGIVKTSAAGSVVPGAGDVASFPLQGGVMSGAELSRIEAKIKAGEFKIGFKDGMGPDDLLGTPIVGGRIPDRNNNGLQR